MHIEIKKFGELLISRPAGREAFLAAKAYTLPAAGATETITLDFAVVNVLSPSWADEFLSALRTLYPGTKLSCVNTSNPSVAATLQIPGF